MLRDLNVFQEETRLGRFLSRLGSPMRLLLAFGGSTATAGVLLSLETLIISFLLSRSFAVVTLIALSRRNSKLNCGDW